MLKVHVQWLLKRWQQDLTCKVWSTKQNGTPFADFVDGLRCDNLLLKGSTFHLSPAQLRTQIESNISSDLAAAFDHWKDNHGSSSDESEKENEPLDNDEAPVALKSVMDALKAEGRLQSFIDMLSRLNQKLIDDRNNRHCETEEAVRSLKCSSLAVRLSESARCAPNVCNNTSSCMPAPSMSSLTSHSPNLMDHE